MKKKVLVVDDNQEFCESLKDILELEGHQVLTAFDGLSALNQLYQEQVDFVLIDLVMADMGGVATIKAIRKISSTVPIIVISAYGDEKLVNEALRSGAKSKIGKPVDYKTLFAELDKDFRP